MTDDEAGPVTFRGLMETISTQVSDYKAAHGIVLRYTPLASSFCSKEELILHALSDLANLALELERQLPVGETPLKDASSATDATLGFLRQIEQWRGLSTDVSDALQKEQINRARFLGASWPRIGTAVGMTAQGIYKKATDKFGLFAETLSPDKHQDG